MTSPATRLTTAAAATAFAVLGFAPLANAHTDTEPHGFVASATARTNSGTPVSASQATPRANQLNFTEQVQENDQWCWAASGTSIARFEGANISQEEFCAWGKGTQVGYCPNQPGTTDDIVQGFNGAGFQAVATGTLSFGELEQQIDRSNPVETGIYWTSGGGHAHVIYGYDDSTQTIDYGDPWPTSQRYSTMSYNSYLSNSQFTWAESVANIHQ